MELLGYTLLFVVSLATLVKASDWCVGAAETIGLALGISPFIIGVTLIAGGTSLPELAASIAAVFADESEIVVANVVGSNVTNILLVLGLTAVVGRKIKFGVGVTDVQVPLLIGSALLLWFSLADKELSLFESTLFAVGFIVFLLNSIRDRPRDTSRGDKATTRHYTMLVVGAGLVYAGAHFTIFSIERLALLLPVSTEVIALTCVALGTSLPEVAVSIAAARRGQAEMAVGNVLGSNIFNTFAVISIPSFIAPLEITQDILDFSLPLMVGVTVLFGFVCLTPSINRWVGWMLLLFYIFFIYNAFIG